MIIKFLDKINPNDQIFNRLLKGKYAFLISATYVIPLSEGFDKFLELEKDNNFPKETRNLLWWDVNDLNAWVDEMATDNINSIRLYELHNNKTPDMNLTMEDLRKTRTNISKMMLCWDDKNKDVWDYYYNGMYNDVVRQLIKYQSTTAITLDGVSCSYRKPQFNVSCDPVEVYKNGIRKELKRLFEDVDYWFSVPESVIKEINTYIKNLIKCDMVPSQKQDYKSLFKNSCEAVDENYYKVLTNASEALVLVLERSDRRNFISMSLGSFAIVFELLEF